ncbi:MAG: tRNA uridine-5-carboxymethylaminomethyl(34) synthesis GTPase MnmE [Syntrophaceae bacterium]|nr:tRNA uridine-5-carboxymethylaminomethyl(34) synthesis GTPase MnmE [Syntrophaceae bacterium]
MPAEDYENDTIVALSSAPGRSGVGVIRISGPATLDIIFTVFKSKYLSDISFKDRHATYGLLIDPDTSSVIDDGIAIFMEGPATYTGEDVVELTLHGSPVILNSAIRLLISRGARLAHRGEFTRRAFLSGRMDLIQAEAVIDLIESETPGQVHDARNRIDSRLSDEVFSISSRLKDVGALIENFLDFDDDEEGPVPLPTDELYDVRRDIESLLESSRSGRFSSRGLTAVITGKPNVGKSTLFNALLGSDRMIISETPGTTRDPVTEKVYIDGVAITLGDTAGVRDNPDTIENEGIKRTLEWVNNCDVALVVLDSSQPIDTDDLTVMESVGAKPKMIIFNKIDKDQKAQAPEQLGASEEKIFRTSAKTGAGLDELRAGIGKLAAHLRESDEFSEKGSLNDRALLLMESAYGDVCSAFDLLEHNGKLELVSLEIKSACDKIDEITGQKFTEDVLDRIFERFCVGK